MTAYKIYNDENNHHVATIFDNNNYFTSQILIPEESPIVFAEFIDRKIV